MNAREPHSEYLPRFLCLLLNITQNRAIQGCDLAYNLASNEANNAYMRFNSEAGARALYNGNPSLAAARSMAFTSTAGPWIINS